MFKTVCRHCEVRIISIKKEATHYCPRAGVQFVFTKEGQKLASPAQSAKRKQK